MDGRDKKLNAAQSGRLTDGDTHSRTVLAVALAPQALDLLPRNVLEPHSYIARVSYEELDSVSLSAAPRRPALVLSPLLDARSSTPSISPVISASAATAGGISHWSSGCPRRSSSAARLKAQSPDLNFDVVVLDGSSPLHSL
jgi:hypothetical protein